MKQNKNLDDIVLKKEIKWKFNHSSNMMMTFYDDDDDKFI